MCREFGCKLQMLLGEFDARSTGGEEDVDGKRAIWPPPEGVTD
jgi:hypothetical protein